MERIKNWLKPGNIYLGLKAQSELGALRTMINLAVKTPLVSDASRFTQSVMDTELYESAFSGCCNISFYALTDSVTTPLFIFGRFDNGIGYFSKQKKPIDLVSLIAAPPGQDKKLADALFTLHTFLCQSHIAEKIRAAATAKEIYRIFMEGPDSQKM